MADDFESSKDLEEKGFRHRKRFSSNRGLQVFSEGVKLFPGDRKVALRGLPSPAWTSATCPRPAAFLKNCFSSTPRTTRAGGDWDASTCC